MTEPYFLTPAEVLELHADQLARFGGSAGVRDMAALEAAVQTPRASFDGEFLHKGLFAMASAYAFHIAESQALIDGNKRTGLNAALVFLYINGYEVPDPEGRLYRAMIDISAHALDKSGLALLLQSLAKPLSP